MSPTPSSAAAATTVAAPAESATAAPTVQVDVLLGPDEWRNGLLSDALAGLSERPRTLSPTWLYDDVGSALYDEITRLPEYYPARTEQTILDAHASDIASTSGADTLVELGSGTSDKTRVLLNALAAGGELRRYVPFDVAEGTLRRSAERIAEEHGIEVHGVVGDFRRHLGDIPGGGRRLIAFLGGTIGNLERHERAAMLDQLTQTMAPGDTLLVGNDLVKDRSRLVSAYDDAAGVTAAFNKNVLNVMNAELGANFDTADFDHVALFDEEHRWIEMRLRSRREHAVTIPALELVVELGEGEELRTEVSSKFLPGELDRELKAAGLIPVGTWTDPAGDFALTMGAKR